MADLRKAIAKRYCEELDSAQCTCAAEDMPLKHWCLQPTTAVKAALAAIEEAGYAMVPVEPTEEMRAAGGTSEPFIWASPVDPTRNWQPGEIVASTCWRAMVAARPKL